MSTSRTAPELKGLVAFELADGARGDVDLASYRPEDPATFALGLDLYVGSPEAATSDAFDLIVCSPRWLVGHFDSPALQSRLAGGSVVPGRGLWLMERWDLDKFRASVDVVLGSVTGERWPDVADWLGRHLPWEHDYRYDEARGLRVDYGAWVDTARPEAPRPPSSGP